MTKVEELKEAILSEARGIQEHGFDTDIPKNLDALIAASADAGARGFCYNGIPRTEVEKLALNISDSVVALITAARTEGKENGH